MVSIGLESSLNLVRNGSAEQFQNSGLFLSIAIWKSTSGTSNSSTNHVKVWHGTLFNNLLSGALVSSGGLNSGFITYSNVDVALGKWLTSLNSYVKWGQFWFLLDKLGKLSSGHRTGKGQFSSQSQIPKKESEVLQLCPTLCNPVDCNLPGRFLRPWDSPGKSTGVGCHFLLQRIYLTQGSNLGLPHGRKMLYHLSHQGSPIPKKGNAKKCSKNCTIALISQASNVQNSQS